MPVVPEAGFVLSMAFTPRDCRWHIVPIGTVDVASQGLCEGLWSMAIIETLPRRSGGPQVLDQPDTFRLAPHNVEAEQALLGAILVNNDAFDRVSDFLQPEHFSEEIHRRIYEVAASLIRAGKIATPITLKTFLGDHDLGGITLPAISGPACRRKRRRSSTPPITAA